MDQKEIQAYYRNRDAYYGVDDKDFIQHSPVDLKDIPSIVAEYGIEPEPTDVESDCLTSDGLLRYNRLSRESRELGRGEKYSHCDRMEKTLEVGGVQLHFSVPKQVTAYDAVPLEYSLTSNAQAPEFIHIGTTTFEEPERCRQEQAAYYDCNLPGRIQIDLHYDGYVVGETVPGYAPVWSHQDFQDQLGTHYPYYKSGQLIRSGTVSSKNEITWFKFSYQNTGDTILDSMGNGSFQFLPTLQRKNEQGEYEDVIFPSTDNLVQRFFDYCYPGDKGEFYVLFTPRHDGPRSQRYRLEPGEYRIVIDGFLHNERESTETFINFARGYLACRYTMDLLVNEEGGVTEPAPLLVNRYLPIPRNKWIGEFEEFQSSYHTRRQVSIDPEHPTTGVLYFQAAPWDRYLTVKLILGDTDQAAMIRLPLAVESDSISIELNPGNPHYIEKPDGTREPMLHTQSMVDMRGNMQMGPDAASTVINDLRDMKEAGINFLNSTMSFAYDAKEFDSFKFMMDCARVMGFGFEAFAHYPFNYPTTLRSAEAVNGGPLNGGYNSWGHKDMNEANGLMANYSYKRYGDQYWMRGDGVVPLAGEDTWGWLTLDHDWRFGMTEDRFIHRLQEWLKDLYQGSIEKLNEAYESHYQDFSEIDPRKDGWYEYSHMGAYTHLASKGVYHERSRAIAELDVFRSLLRLENYKSVLELSGIPNAKFWIRYEGSAWLAAGIDPYTKNSHYRHQFYEQRRNAMIPEILAASGLVYGGSNYDGLPLTAREVYEMTRRSSDIGLYMAKLPMLSYMCDIVINPLYGDPKYTEEYNLKQPAHGATVFTTTALFPYLKAMYEGGGLPGVMWQDYHCSGFVTSVQFKELKFYHKKIQEMLATEKGKEWATHFKPADRSSMQGVLAKWSYPREYVEQMLEQTKRVSYFDPPKK